MFQNLFILMKKGKKRKKKWSSLLLEYYPFDYSTYSIIYFKGNNYSLLLEVRPF